MTKAEEAAMKAYPKKMIPFFSRSRESYDCNTGERKAYIEGYQQAEKDLSWHSVDESLPPKGEEVIVLSNVIVAGLTIPVNKISYGHIVDSDDVVDYNGWDIPGVHHWMFYPKLPKVKIRSNLKERKYGTER